MASSTVMVKDPKTGGYTLTPGAGSAPLGGSPNVGDLGIGGGSVGSGQAVGDPYTKFNQNIANILMQIQAASTAGRQRLGGAKDAIATAAVTGGPAYDPTLGNANAGQQQATLGGFAPEVTSINTQLSNSDASLRDLETNIGAIQQANQPEVLSPGQSLVTKGGTVLKEGHQYTPQTNPNTGMTEGFDVNTGTWASDDGGSPAHGVATSIESIFGKSNPIGAYATDKNYVQEISGLYSTVSGLGVTQSPDMLQTYIQHNAKAAPVTGQMILNAASTYGIDPALLTTVLLHESDFGTAGVGAKTMNPGNQGNTGTSTQAYNSWQQGVMATAKNLANRMAAAGVSATSGQAPAPTQQQNTTSPVGGNFSDAASQKIQQLPAAYRSYVDAGPLGVAYINNDRVPENIKPGLQTMASRAGIPFVQAADVGAIKSVETVLGNLDSMQTLANTVLGSGLLGRAKDSILGKGAEMLQTSWGRQLGLFDNYRDTAIKAVQALAGGAGSGLRINMGEIAANTQNLPKSTDNLENATVNIKQLKQLIYTQLATTFPYAQVKVTNPQGQEGTIPAGNLNAAIQKGYTVK